MSASRGAWISKRGQAGADSAIGQVLDRQPGEPLLQVADAQIEDSPYQARRPFSDASVAELAQGMRAVGFQGVLIVRPHPDPLRRREELYQLAYGHRRRAAWRRVCAERGEACLLPVVVRELSDERMLTIGAQENLQRADLDPIEEAQIVDWHQRMFAQLSQAEIGAMLGKSSDWVSMRARVHRLPGALKQRLRERPRAISQMLELSALVAQRPDDAERLADRIVAEQLTLEQVRALVRGYTRPSQAVTSDRENENNRRGAATIVGNITGAQAADSQHGTRQEPTDEAQGDTMQTGSARASVSTRASRLAQPEHNGAEQDDPATIEDIAVELAAIASRATHLAPDAGLEAALEEADRALGEIRLALTRKAFGSAAASRGYRLSNLELPDLLARLLGRRPVIVTMQHGQAYASTLSMVLVLMPWVGSGREAPTRQTDLFVAVSGAGHGVVPLSATLLAERARNSLGLTSDAAAAITALIADLARAQGSR